MENQTLLNTIAVLSSSLDPLLRANKKDVVDTVAIKIKELTEQIKTKNL
jgi:hypothetical protein